MKNSLKKKEKSIWDAKIKVTYDPKLDNLPMSDFELKKLARANARLGRMRKPDWIK